MERIFANISVRDKEKKTMSKSTWYMASTIGTKVNEVVVVSETTHRVTLQYHDWTDKNNKRL